MPAPASDDIARFLSRILPPPAQGRAIGIHYAFKNPATLAKYAPNANGKSPLPGRAFHTVDDAVHFVRRWLGGMTARGLPDVDFYASMALCGMESINTNPDGTVKMRATRQIASMAASRALYADLDVKPTAYATRQDALDHIDALVAAGKLPPTTVRVDSGYGVHVYWILDRELNRAEWYTLGPAFSTYLSTLGVHHDPAVTSDGVRVLRLPGTFNCKDLTNPVPTKLIGAINAADVPVVDFERLLNVSVANAKVRPAQPLQTQHAGGAVVSNILPASFAGVTAPGAAGAGNFAAGIDHNAHIGQPVDFEKVVANCPTLADIDARGGAGDPEPLWSLALLAASFAPVDDAREWAHRFSEFDSRYTEAATDAKFDQKLQDRQRSGGRIGWPTCKAFAALSTTCQTCPLLAQGKTPFHGAVDNSDMPEGYYRQGGNIMMLVKEEDGNATPVVVLPYGVIDAYMESSAHGPQLNVEVVHAKNPPQRLVLPVGAATAWRDAALSALGTVGVALLPHQIPLARSFFVAFIQHLQERQGDLAARAPYGWTKARDGSDGFAFAGRIYRADGQSEQAPPGDRTLGQIYRSVGTLDRWKQAADMVMGMGRVDLQTIIATAFAAPLVHFSGQTGVVFSAYTPHSGAQKSTAMKVSQSVWGDPITGMSRLDDTSNHVGKKLGQVRHLPVYWDEIQSPDQAATFAKLGFALTLGVEKGRMGADTQLREAGSWATMLVVASNPSIREIMLSGSMANSAAGVNRLLESEIVKVPLTTSASAASIVVEQTHRNYGLVGVLYAQLLAQESSKLSARLERVSESFEKLTNAQPDERFWILAAATIFLGAALANNLDGGRLIQFDLPALRTHLVNTILRQRIERARDVMDFDSVEFAVSVIQDYISHSRKENECLETDRFPVGQGRQLISIRMPNVDAYRMLKAPKLHIAHDDGLIRATKMDFRKWVVVDRKLPYDVVCRALQRFCGMTDVRARWAGGTPFALAAMTVYQFDVGAGRTPVGSLFSFGAVQPTTTQPGTP